MEKLSKIFETLIIEAQGKEISVNYLKSLMKTNNKNDYKILASWVFKGGGDLNVTLTPRQYKLLQKIKNGTNKPQYYSSKN